MYQFRREDTGEIVEVDFETHMSQDRGGFITLPDGVKARRVNDFHNFKPSVEYQNANRTPPPSDSLGFTSHQLAEFEEDRVRNGHTGIEFKPDPMCPDFYQVHFASHQARDDYVAHRGMVDMNKTAGSGLSKKALLDAAEMVKNRYKNEETG